MALKRLEGCRTLAEGTKAIINLGLEKVPVPGESGFPFPGLFPLPQSQKEAGETLFLVVFAFNLTHICWRPLHSRQVEKFNLNFCCDLIVL